MQLECLEFCLGIYDESFESLWIRIVRQTNMDVSYWLPGQEIEVDEV